jgi:hypothetical protein
MADLPIISNDGGQPIVIVDKDTSTVTDVTAASSAALATNSALVVALSPNSPVPTGSNNIGSITNITGTISLPTGAATAANQATEITSLATIAGAIIGQGSTTAGQTGNLVLGAVTTASPAYTTAQSSPLSLDTSGNLRVVSTAQPDDTVTGTIAAANGTVTLTGLSGTSSSFVSISGTWFGTAFVQGQNGDGNWVITDIYNLTQDYWTQSLNSSNANGRYIVSVGGFTQVRVLMAGYTSGTANVTINASTGAAIPVTRYVRATYSASAVNTTMAATPTDVLTISGAATKRITITRLKISGTQTTAAMATVSIVKRSAADTGGTSAALTIVPHDSNNPTSQATVLGWTANPTGLGASVGVLRTYKLFLPATAGTTPFNPIVDLDFSHTNGFSQGIVLHSTAEILAINFNGVTLTGNSMCIDIEWFED